MSISPSSDNPPVFQIVLTQSNTSAEIDLKNIKGFENLSEFNLSYKSFNELVDKEIEILSNQILLNFIHNIF